MSFYKILRIGGLFPTARLASTTATQNGGLLYPMRSLFFTKKTRAALEKVGQLRPDVVVLDLEDSVKSSEKESMRELYASALKENILRNTKVFVRSNSFEDYEDMHKDITIFTGKIDGFIIPKVEKKDDVINFEELVSEFEGEKRIPDTTKLIPVVETAPSYFNLGEIALASKRNIAIIGGSGDFTADVLCEDHSPTYDAYFSKIVLAAKSANILPIWGVHDKIDDHIGFAHFCHKAKRCGFGGAVALTPKQITMANEAFSLSVKEADWIEKVSSNGRQIESIKPSVQESRQMIGPPHRIKADNMAKEYVKTSVKLREKPITKPSNGLSAGVKIGEVVTVPHEVTITDSLINSWDSSFLKYSSNELTAESDSDASSCVPFSLCATLTIGLSVCSFSYHARVHLGFKNIFQDRPLVSGDRVRAMFRIEDVKLKKGSDNNLYAVATSKHWLVNQDNKVVLQLEKTTMFQPDHCAPKLEREKLRSLDHNDSQLYKSLLLQNLSDIQLPLRSTPVLSPGEVIIHDVTKVMGYSETRSLCSLLKIVNPHHHNIIRYSHTDILVPGPFTMSAAISNATLDVGEILYEEIPLCSNPNKVNLGDQIGTMTHIEKCSVLDSNPQLEEVILRHIAVKNTDMEVLSKIEIPQQIFSEDTVKPSDYEHICARDIPLLFHKIVCVVKRRVIRLRPGLSKPAIIPHELL